jgi:hypothetical protein
MGIRCRLRRLLNDIFLPRNATLPTRKTRKHELRTNRKLKIQKTIVGLLPLVVFQAFAPGCSNSHGTAGVSGTVLYKNQPVDGATVVFHPKGDMPTAKPAQGKSESGGRFTVSTYFGPDEQPVGALPGDYTVTVTNIDEPKGAFDPHKDPPPKNHLPTKYSTPQTSPLTVTVKPGGNRPKLSLED